MLVTAKASKMVC